MHCNVTPIHAIITLLTRVVRPADPYPVTFAIAPGPDPSARVNNVRSGSVTQGSFVPLADGGTL